MTELTDPETPDRPTVARGRDLGDELLCSRLTTETGSIVELWETEFGFELLFAESHRPAEIVHAVELRRIEVEALAGSMLTAVNALAAESNG